MTTIRNRRKRNTAVPIAVLLILAAAVTAVWIWHPWPAGAVTVPPGAKAGDIFLESCPTKIGGVEYPADCGTLVAPENRGDPESRLIALPIQRIHSPAPQPAEPIFVLDGGPGISNMQKVPPSWLLADHDFVKVGYRGVDGSPRLDCPAFGKALLGHGGDLLGPESLDRIGEAAAACAADLQAKGTDLRGYSIPEVVEDMEAARTALGFERIDLLSESYGTRVAQVYAYMHPESLLRSAMIGVNPPGHFLFHPETFDALIRRYADLCRKDSACRARTPDLAASMRKVSRSMPTSWLGLPINPGKVRAISEVLLYLRSTAPIVFDAYLAAERGDPSGLALMTLAYDFIMPNVNVWGEFMAIGCSADYEPGRDYRSELLGTDSIIGAPLSELVWGSAPGNWPPILMDDEYRQARPTDVETLLISGSVDFSTPAQFAEQELLPYLNKGRQVVISEQGHTSDFWRFQTEAAKLLLTSFFNTGQADDSLYEYLPMDFKAPMSFPLLAKIFAGAVIGLSLALGLVVCLIVRRFRRKVGN
jgi:pimeloyl-ACP methyl ester carboxylesterase